MAMLPSVKMYETADGAVSKVESGSTIMVGGFGDIGVPFTLIDALVRRGPTDLTIIANNCGAAAVQISLGASRVRVFPSASGESPFC